MTDDCGSKDGKEDDGEVEDDQEYDESGGELP